MFASWNEAMEAFCETLSADELDLLIATDMLSDAMCGWCEAKGYSWMVPA